MKNPKKLIGLFVMVSLLGCKKEITTNHPVNEALPTQQTSNKYGVEVKNGTLKFESFEKYNELLNLPEDKKEEFYHFAENLANFTSRNEFEIKTGYKAGKTTTDCNCDIDDEYIKSIVDANYMVIIENFRVKLDGCDRKVYVSDELAADAATRYSELLACNFANPALFKYTFDQSVETELPLVRDSLNGISIAGKRCTEVAISRRYASLDAGTGPNGQSYPKFDLEYNNFGISGRIRATMNNNNNASFWQFEWQSRYYKVKCGSVTNQSPGTSSKSLIGSAYKYDIHNGSRLTNAPTSTNYLVQMRLSRSGPNDQSPYIQIVP